MIRSNWPWSIRPFDHMLSLWAIARRRDRGRRPASSALIVHVDAHRPEQHQALDDLLIVDADAENGHAVVHHPHDHGADHGTADAADPAIGRGAADEAG